MTRFFMKIEDAIDLVLYALKNGKHGDLWVYNNKSCTIKEIADLFSDKQEIMGNRCEEKTDEALLTINELNHSDFIEDKYFRVNKDIESNNMFKEPLTSDNADRLTKKELQELLESWREYENDRV